MKNYAHSENEQEAAMSLRQNEEYEVLEDLEARIGRRVVSLGRCPNVCSPCQYYEPIAIAWMDMSLASTKRCPKCNSPLERVSRWNWVAYVVMENEAQALFSKSYMCKKFFVMRFGSYVKFGISKYPEKAIEKLNTDSIVKMHLLFSIPLLDDACIDIVKHKVKSFISGRKMHDEWYQLDDAVVSNMKKIISDAIKKRAREQTV